MRAPSGLGWYRYQLHRFCPHYGTGTCQIRTVRFTEVF
jgi:hypothetical protein